MTEEAFSLVNLTFDKISGAINNAQNLIFSIAAGESFSMDNKDVLIAEYVRNYARNNRLISETIYYINTAMNVICSRQVYYDILGNPMLTTLVENAWNHSGIMHWSQPYHSPLIGTTVAIVYPVESKTGERLGVLIIELNIGEIREILNRQLLTKGKSYVLLTSEGNNIVMDRTNAMLPLENGYYYGDLTDESKNLLLDSPEGVSRQGINNRDLVIVRSMRNRTGWILFSIIDRKIFSTDLDSFTKIQIGTGIFWILLLLAFAAFISYNFSMPIKRLISHMASYKDPESALPVSMIRRDEIGTLADSYNQLLDKIKNLVTEVKKNEQEKKQYYLNMLQNQIQPHFLYNTLACISSMAKQNRISEVRNTISSLVNLLSFTFDKPVEMVSLTEELEVIGMYVQIQKVRYGDIFTLVFSVTNEAKTKKIPKLTLQPVIDNTIINSVIPSHRNCVIKLSAAIDGENLVINIEDNGLGVKTEKAGGEGRINPRALDVFAHVGMINADKRIRLYYGPQYGITVFPEEKSCVSVVLPAEEFS
jgi:sensor histidine kinase YesM